MSRDLETVSKQLIANRSERRVTCIAMLAIAAATIIAFGGVVQFGFVDWDDDHLLILNDAYRGLSFGHLYWMFTTTLGGHYQPLTWLSYAVDFELSGDVQSWAMHLTNLVLHLATTIGVFFLARRVLSAVGAVAKENGLAALIAALFWGVHPLRVESVAWVTERRDVLSGFWWVAATLAYFAFADQAPGKTRRRLWILTLGCYTLSLLSKAAGMTWPLVMLLADAFPLRRWRGISSASSSQVLRACIIEKIPFFLLAATASMLALAAQRSAGALWTTDVHSMGLRLAQAGYGIIFYLIKTIFPYPLLPLYEQPPDAAATEVIYLASWAAVAGITVGTYGMRRRIPALFVGWLVFVILLSPTLGLAQSGPQLVADRYTYLPGIVLALGAGSVVQLFQYRKKHLKAGTSTYPMALCFAVLFGLAVLARRQSNVWQDTETLWTHVLRYAPKTGLAHANLAALKLRTGDAHAAAIHAATALEILPRNRLAHVTRAGAAAAMGDLVTAERQWAAAIAAHPLDNSLLIQRAITLSQLGRIAESESLFRQALTVEPEVPEWRAAYGGFLATHGRIPEAIAELGQAVRLNPLDLDSRYRLGVLYDRQGNPAGAKHEWEEVLRHDEAHLDSLMSMAWLLSTCPEPSLLDGPKAMELAIRAWTLTKGRNHRAIEVLSAAKARTGDFDGARSELTFLLKGDTGELPPSMRTRVESAAKSYEKNLPFVDRRE